MLETVDRPAIPKPNKPAMDIFYSVAEVCITLEESLVDAARDYRVSVVWVDLSIDFHENASVLNIPFLLTPTPYKASFSRREEQASLQHLASRDHHLPSATHSPDIQ